MYGDFRGFVDCFARICDSSLWMAIINNLVTMSVAKYPNLANLKRITNRWIKSESSRLESMGLWRILLFGKK